MILMLGTGLIKGAIPSGNVENSDEFTHNPVHPAGAAAELASGETRRAFPKERRSNREVACGRIFATVAGPGFQ